MNILIVIAEDQCTLIKYIVITIFITHEVEFKVTADFDI